VALVMARGARTAAERERGVRGRGGKQGTQEMEAEAVRDQVGVKVG
jgi:hypothetical protein